MVRMVCVTLLVIAAASRTAAAEIVRPVEPIPERYWNVRKVALMLEGLTEKKLESGRSITVKLRLINPTDANVLFTGYSEAQPLYRMETWTGWKWKKDSGVWDCAVGWQDCIIRPGESSVISIDVSSRERTFPIRVGMSYYLTERPDREWKDVWSDEIPLKAFDIEEKLAEVKNPEPEITFKKRYPPKMRPGLDR